MYGKIIPGPDVAQNYKGLMILYPKSDGILSPDLANELGFSNFSNQVAYFTNKMEGLKLWIGSANLDSVWLAWEDEEGWLIDVSSLRWGPGDRFIIAASETKPDHLLIYDLYKKVAKKWKGKCNLIAKSTLSENLTLWCESSDRSSYAVLDDTITIQSTPPIQATVVKEWAFSFNEEKVLYAKENNQYTLASKNNVSILPINYIDDLWYMRTIKWSEDNKRILLYGDDKGKGICKKNLNGANLIEDFSHCWMVINSETSQVIWSPTDYMANKFNLKWNILTSAFDAALSPDGNWIVMFLEDTQIFLDYGIVTQIDSGETYFIYDSVAVAVSWNR
jgi:hypothetical protein